MPSGYSFANEWQDYPIPQYSGVTFSHDVLAIIHHKTVAFFNTVQPVIARTANHQTTNSKHHSPVRFFGGAHQ
jgi:hypothetical protein